MPARILLHRMIGLATAWLSKYGGFTVVGALGIGIAAAGGDATSVPDWLQIPLVASVIAVAAWTIRIINRSVSTSSARADDAEKARQLAESHAGELLETLELERRRRFAAEERASNAERERADALARVAQVEAEMRVMQEQLAAWESRPPAGP